jgi:hypothetical protein
MLRGDLISILKEMSNDFRFYAPLDQYTNASLWINTNCGQEHELVCALPRNEVPEYTLVTPSEIKARGWRDVFHIVRHKKTVEGKYAVHPSRFWKVLHKHGIYSLDRAVVMENDNEKRW